MNDLRVLLVDDEPLALDYMTELLSTVEGIEIIGRCRSGREALAVLQTESVDLMFLDIQMPGLSGFDVVKRVQSDITPVVVFATAFDEFAVKAFEANAVDYLLKPFEASRVKEAVDRARSRLISAAVQSGKDAAVAAVAGLEGRDRHLNQSVSSERPARLPIKDGPHTHLVELKDIDWIDAAGDYMCVHASNETYILRSTMKELEKKLSDEFVRIHRSTIVNLNKVRSVDGIPKGECLLHLDHEVTLKVSRNYRSAVQNLMS